MKILRAGFTHADPKSAKRSVNLTEFSLIHDQLI